MRPWFLLCLALSLARGLKKHLLPLSMFASSEKRSYLRAQGHHKQQKWLTWPPGS